MRFLKILLFTTLVSLFLLTPSSVRAADCQFTTDKTQVLTSDTLTVTVTGTQKNGAYGVQIKSFDSNNSLAPDAVHPKNNGDILTFNVNLSDGKFKDGPATVRVVDYSGNNRVCQYDTSGTDSLVIDIRSSTTSKKNLTIATDPASPMKDPFKTLNSMVIGGLDQNKTYQLKMTTPNIHYISHPAPNNNDWKTESSTSITVTDMCENGNSERNGDNKDGPCTALFADGVYRVDVIDKNGNSDIGFVTFDVATGNKGGGGIPGRNPCEGGSCDTAIGTIPTNPADFVGAILKVAIGLAGGIALIFMVMGAIKVITSSGDQQKLNGGRDMIVAAVSGLLFLILSVLILRFIGTSLLGGLPGF